MIRKSLAMLLCLLLALSLPFTALAATEYTISAVPGDDIKSEAAIADLLNILSVKVLAGEQSGMLSIVLNDVDALSLALRADADGVYVECGALHDSAFFFSKDDIATQLSALMKQSGADSDDTAALAQSLEQAFAKFFLGAPVTEDGQSIQMLEALANDPAIIDFSTGLMSKIKLTEGTYSDPAYDPATQLMELTITSEDLLKLADSETLQKLMTSNESMTAEELKAKITKLLNSVEITVPMSVYVADNGVTAFRIPLTAKGEMETTTTKDGKSVTQTKEVNIAADMDYNRLTTGDKAAHSLTVSAQNQGKPVAVADCVLTADDAASLYELTAALSGADGDAMKEVLSVKGALTTEADKDSGWLGMLADGTQFTMDYGCTHTENGNDKSIAIYTRSKAVSILEPGPADRPIITLKVSVRKDAAEDALAAVNAATPENSAQILQMTGDEQAALIEALQTKGMQLLLGLVSQLPASTMELFMGGF